jgi:hypothetical protein
MIFGRKQSQEPKVGDDVVTNDEEVLGDVSAITDDYLEVEPTSIGSRMKWRVPRSAISKIEEDIIHLNVSRGQAIAKGWEIAAGASGGGSEATSSNA